MTIDKKFIGILNSSGIRKNASNLGSLRKKSYKEINSVIKSFKNLTQILKFATIIKFMSSKFNFKKLSEEAFIIINDPTADYKFY